MNLGGLVPRWLRPPVLASVLGLTAIVASTTTGRAWTSSVAIILVAGGWMCSTVFRRKRFERAGAALEKLAGGDLTLKLEVGDDEDIELLFGPVREIVDQLNQLVLQLGDSKRRLDEGWRAVDDVAWQMLETSESAAVQASTAAEAASQLSSSMQVIATATEELTTTIQEMARHASEVSVDASRAAAQVSDANGTVADLGAAGRQVRGIVKLIVAIAGQTRLLALNATIEAARAGEFGRGFTVVADEVKLLAQETHAATDNVGQIVTEMRENTSQATDAMAGVTSTISRVSDNQQAIAAAVEQQTAAVNEIGSTAADAANGSSGLVGNVSELVTAVRVTAYAGAEARTVASELADLASEVEVMRCRYRAVGPATDGGTGEIAKAAATVDGAVTTIRNNVFGNGLNEIDYRGKWCHSKQNLEAEGTNSYSSMPGDRAVVRFNGKRVRVFGFAESNHGKAAISIDGGPETVIDQFGTDRRLESFFESSDLPPGEHTLCARVTGERNPASRYIWVTLEHVEIDAH